MATPSYTIEVKGKKPFVVIQLKKYEAMLEYMEELEDRADIVERSDDESTPWADVKKEITDKLSKK